MRRVAIISDAVPERNGVGAYYRDLIDQLDEQGYEAKFICPTGKSNMFSFPLPGDATQRVWLPSLPRFRRILRGLMPETVIVATPGPFGLLGAWWAKRLGARLIVGFHTHFSSVTDLYGNRLLRPLSRFYFRFADRYLFRHGDLVLGNSDAMVELAKKLGARKAELMGTLLPTPCRNKPVAPPRDLVQRVLFAGRLAPEKRVDTVLAAAEQLPELQFSVAGDGPQKSEVMEKAQRLPNLAYLGWVSRDQIIQQMDHADVLVLPSYVESFGTVALEAMARQRLALVSPNCGILDWSGVKDSLYRIGDGESVTDALRRVVELAPAERQQLALRAHDAANDLNSRSLAHWQALIENGAASCIS
ncbi:MAG: glycosyltransferase [Woeseiaceae bacterium]|nr:glycosyltransferase [Woeseiaceae bacterium]